MDLDEIARARVNRLLASDLPRGAAVGGVWLADVVRQSPSPWAVSGAWNWLIEDADPYDEPVPCTGRLGLWYPRAELLEAISAQGPARR